MATNFDGILTALLDGEKKTVNVRTTADQVLMEDGTRVSERLEALGEALAGQRAQRTVPTIADRDALADAVTGDIVWVVDASPEYVGAAKYLRLESGAWAMLGTGAAGDLTQTWDNISDGPTSSPEAVDLAVDKKHTHANALLLDGFGVNTFGQLTLNQERVGDYTLDCVIVPAGETLPTNLRDGAIILEI